MLTHFAEIFLEVINRSVAVTVVIMIVFLVRFFLGKYPKKYSYILWTLVAVRMMFDISVPTGSLFPRLAETPSVVQSLEEKSGFGNKEETRETIVSFVSGNNAHNEQTQAVSDAQKQTQAFTQGSRREMVQTVLFLVWLAGIAVFFVVQMLAFFRLKKSVRQAVLLQENIYECDNIPSPFVLGVLKAKIYVPFGLNETEQGYILAHERYHIKRFDQLTRLLATILLMVYWINPFVWLAYFCFVRDQEMSCDEAVLHIFGNGIKKEYSSLLLGFATNNRKFMAVPLAFGESDAGKRIKNVLNYKRIKTLTIAGIIAVIVIATVAAALLTGSRKNNDNAVSGTETENTKNGQSARDNGNAENDQNAESVQSTESRQTQENSTDVAGASSNNVTGVFAEELYNEELSMEKLITMVEDKNWETFVDTHDITYWKQFSNLEEEGQMDDGSITDELRGHFLYEGKQYELTVAYWPEENALEYGETPDAVDDIWLTEMQTFDAIGLYHADKRYYANTDIETFLNTVYDISAEITMDEVVISGAPDNVVVTLGKYGQDVLFDGFSGNLFEFNQYKSKAHGESCLASWYSAGGIGEWKGEKDDAFVYDGDKLAEVTISGNHMDKSFLQSFETDDFSGLFYEYDFEIFTASESEEAGIKNYDDMVTKYWVAFLSAGEEEPVYMVFFNQDCFNKEQALSYAKSVRKVK